MCQIEALVARGLNIGVDRLNDDIGYQSIAEWDSFAHVNLMLFLSEQMEIEMSDDLMLELTSVAAIKGFASKLGVGSKLLASDPHASSPQVANPAAIHRGLAGIHFDHSTITEIDGDAGRLAYRGYAIDELAEHATFEETTWLLLEGELPTATEVTKITGELAVNRSVPAPVLSLLDAIKHAHPMDALRTAVSALGALDFNRKRLDLASSRHTGLQLIAQVPTLIAAHHALRHDRAPVAPQLDLSHAHDFLRMLLGHDPEPGLAGLMDQDLIVHADHSANASAFAARVAIGCGVGTHAALTAALAAFAGPLHGGAVEQALAQIDRIGAPEKAASFVRDQQGRNQPVMGFGHRVYRTEDPRVRHFRHTAREMSRRHNDTRAFEIVEALVEAMQPFARLGIGPNVDLYAGLTYRLLGLPDDMAAAIFAAGRMPGWIAQIEEQRANNILIRPLLRYVGTSSRPFVPLQDRAAASEIAV